MRKEKTQKRLVTKEQYVRVMGKKVTIYSFSGLLWCCGGICFLLALLLTVYAFFPTPSHDLIPPLIWALLLGGISRALFWISKSFLIEGQAIAHVEPITRHNQDQLPAEESLVRASTEPPVDQQAELLRAAQGGRETPQEQLLRSAQE